MKPNLIPPVTLLTEEEGAILNDAFLNKIFGRRLTQEQQAIFDKCYTPEQQGQYTIEKVLSRSRNGGWPTFGEIDNETGEETWDRENDPVWKMIQVKKAAFEKDGLL